MPFNETDPVARALVSIDGPFVYPEVVTPDDINDLPYAPVKLLLSAAATVRVTTLGMADDTYIDLPLPAGYQPGLFKRVWSTGTDAGVSIILLK